MLSETTSAAQLPVPSDLLRVWWAVSGMLVLLMQLGFIHVEMGSVQPKDRHGIALKNLILLLVSTLGYAFIGFPLMYGESLGGIIGNPLKLDPQYAARGFEWFFLQLGFASVAATILSGSIAGRTSLLSNALLAFIVGAVLFPLFGHWVWSDEGWLHTRFKVADFAGSGVVHLIGGLTALVAASVVGPRRDARLENGALAPHVAPRSLSKVTMGVVFLWIGWIGFNGGSISQAQAEEHHYLLVGHAIVATCIAACTGGMAALVVGGIHRRLYGVGRHAKLSDFLVQGAGFDPYATLSGAMGGMVAITANCPWVEDRIGVAGLIGIAGGLATFFVSNAIRARVDDPADAIAVHAGAGSTGLLLAMFGDGPTLLGQLIALGAAVACAVTIIYPACKLLQWLELFRVSERDEREGLSWEPPTKVIAPLRSGQLPRSSSRGASGAGVTP